jgi:hypothetical protein
MYMVWHVDKHKITYKLVISHWTNKILVAYFSIVAFRHIQEYYSPQNISTIKYLFMKNA